MGWKSTGANRTVPPSVASSAILRIELPLVDRLGDGLVFRLAGFSQDQLCPDVAVELVQGGVSTSRCPARPVAVASLTENHASPGQQRPLRKLSPEEARARVRDHRSRIVARGQSVPEELVHPELLGAGNLNLPVQRRAD